MGEIDIPTVPGRSFLTKSQRQYLFGKDFDSDRERQLRFQIRKNIQSALMDFQLLDNLEERDRLQAFAPLSAYYEYEDIAEWLKLEDMDLADTGSVNGDPETGGLMHQGLTDLLTWYILYYGPSVFEHLAQRALNVATATHAVERERNIGAYNISIEHTTISDVWEQ